MRFKWYTAVALLALSATLPALCQNGDKLQLSGSVGSVSSEKARFGEKEYNYFKIQLGLQFRNLTDHPLIIFRPSSFLVRTNLSFLDSANSQVEAEFFFERRWRESNPQHDVDETLKRSLRDLAAFEPNPNYFLIIPPRSYYECVVTFLVENGYEAEPRVGRSPADVYDVVIPKFQELKLRYSVSTKKWPGQVGLETARENWKKFGELVLNSDGDYNIESDHILNIISR
jgi:hypothetical protein